MRISSFLLLLSICFLTQKAAGQTDCSDKFDAGAIQIRESFWRGTIFQKNGKTERVGIFYRNLRPDLESTVASKSLFKKANRNQKIAAGVSLVAAGMAVVGASQLDENATTFDENKRGAGLFLAGLALDVFIALPLAFRAKQQVNDAVWEHNRAILKKN